MERGQAEGRQRVARAADKFFWRNTSDLQWKMRANYKATLCESSRKAVGAETMGKQWKKQCADNRNRAKNHRTRSLAAQMKTPADEQRRATLA
jgi:hypothetical protein